MTVGREKSLALLRAHKSVLAERFGVADIALFGSTARGDAASDSDVDVSWFASTAPLRPNDFSASSSTSRICWAAPSIW